MISGIKLLMLFAFINQIQNIKYSFAFKLNYTFCNITSNKIINQSNYTETKDNVDSVDFRLPNHIIPMSYTIIIHPILLDNNSIDSFTLRGDITIKTRVNIETDELIFHHGENITINEISIINNKKGLIDIRADTYCHKPEKHIYILKPYMPENSTTVIRIAYNGILRDDMIGFYKSSFFSESAKIKWLAATQFQTSHARHAFPCFDEPHLKAHYTIIIRRPKSYRSLSNMPLVKTVTIDEKLQSDTYQSSIPMSSYLVAFVVSDDLRCKQDEKNNLTIWAQPLAVNLTDYALKIAPQVLNYLENLFNESYQLKKMDMVAVPDFLAGTMDNWGFITYRENHLLFNENETSDINKQKILSTVVHKCTNIWFGNLVTPEWWGYLWLSDAFANYYQYFGTSKIEPNWMMDQQYIVDHLQSVFQDDAVGSSKPITRRMNSTVDIAGISDRIIYSKGGSILRMMNLAFGEEIFNYAIQSYLKTKKFQSATPNDLWNSFQSQFELNNKNHTKIPSSIQTIMNSWTLQPGYPILTVTLQQNNHTVKLEQERFFIRKTVQSELVNSKNVTWWIPVTWTTQAERNFNSTSPKHWFNTKNYEINFNNTVGEWIIFNIQQSGFYRVNYDNRSWDRIIYLLNSDFFKEINVINRAAIIDDLLNLARAGLVNYTVALNGIKYIRRETEYLPFKSALNGIEYLHKRFVGQENYQQFANFILHLITPMYERLNFEDNIDDDRLTILLRAELNQWACKLNHTECIKKSLKFFSDWMKDSLKTIPKNQKNVVYCTASRFSTFANDGSSPEYDALNNLLNNFTIETLTILEAQACTHNKNVLKRISQKILDGFESSKIRKQDGIYFFQSVAKSSLVGAEYIFEFFNENYDRILHYLRDSNLISNIISIASQQSSTKNLINKFEIFITNHSQILHPIMDSLNSSLELFQFELEFYEKYSPSIISWIKQYNDTFDKNSTEELKEYRLPTDVIPKHYNIRLTPFIEPRNFTFIGHVEIISYIVHSTNKVTLHVHDIQCNTITLSIDGKNVETISIIEDTKYNFLSITTIEQMIKGSELNITIEYTGNLNAEMSGFYRSSYIDDFNETKWLVATHLEPVGARRVFPCFDEPGLKATFKLSVSRPANYKALSNTILESTVEDGDRYLDTFKTTPNMSSYLLAIIVSDFNSVSKDINYSAWARPNAIRQADYSSSIMKPIVNYFEKTLGHAYQLSKLDMIALPDFASGAMENWGLITYRETNMLYHPDYSPITSKQAIASVVAHEIAHQWFGNLVSPHWWNYVWLSEGFARYYQYHATETIEPEWGLECQYVVEQLQTSFYADSLLSSHPMSHNVSSPAEISSIFDTISYSKASSILRMAEKVYGTKIFYAALNEYLNKRKYLDAKPDDLFTAFQKEIDTANIKLNIKTIMDSWTTQAGFPVVNVTIDNETVSLSQERFLLKKRNYDISIKKLLWWIPITWTSNMNLDFNTTIPTYWFNKSNDLIKINISTSNEWIIFNIQQAGYYRVNYDIHTWSRLIHAFKSVDFKKIHIINRASIIDDALNLARAGYIDYSIAFNITQYLSHEVNYIPWRAAFNGLSFLKKKFTGTSIYGLFQTHISTILEPIYKKLNFNETSYNHTHYDKLLRRYVIRWACEFGIGDCINNSINLFARWKSNNSQLVTVDLRDTIYCTAIKYGTEDDWKFLWNIYKRVNVAHEKIVIINALGCSKNKARLDKLLSNAINENSGMRFQDSLTVFSSVYNSGLFGAEHALNFVDKHYDVIFKYYGKYETIANILNGISSQFSTKQLVSKFENFINDKNKNMSTIQQSLRSYLNRAYDELDWYNQYSPKIFEWLDKTYPDSDFRLSTTMYPVTYEIYLTPYLDNNNFTFDGQVKINITVNQNTSSIVLHANKLNIKNITVSENYTKDLAVYSYFINSTTNKFTIYLSSTVNNGSNLTVIIEYTGVLNNNMEGFYRSYYKDDIGNTHWLATTQFEKFGARQAFPCFDEPAFKAKYKINIQRPNDYHSLSNMPIIKSVLSEKLNWTWDYYEQSVPMSSYLVAFIISDFKSLKNIHNNFTVWSRPNAIQYTANALDYGQKALKFLENYTGIPYPINKMELVAIPDFAAGAMENWGLVTFREYGLILKEDITSTYYMRYLYTVIAHELVHMWFGNLVTCDWWEYLWLNEGFAQYLEWVVSDSIFPEAQLMEQFVVYEIQPALLKDSFIHMRPMNNKMNDPYDDGKDFTSVVYGKAASVIHMMKYAVGEYVFKASLHHYLDKHKFSTGKPEYLWSALQININQMGGLNGTTNETIFTLMNSWASQAGYPVVHAHVIAGSLILTQERFLITGRNNSAQELYWIPITIMSKSNTNVSKTAPALWLGERSIITDKFNLTDEWFIINVNQIGYYRVNYDTNNWNYLIEALNSNNNFGGISEINRAQIIDNLFNLARADYISYDFPLRTSMYLMKEKNHIPWKSFLNTVTFLIERFDGHEEIENRLKEYVLKIMEPIYNELGFENKSSDTDLDKLNRQIVLSWACQFGYTKCIEKAKQIFDVWRVDESQYISSDAKPAVFCTALKYGNFEDWQFMWQEYRASNFESEKMMILTALGCSRNVTAINKYLSIAISSDGSIRYQNVANVLSSIYSAEKYGLDLSIEFLINNYTDIYKFYNSWDAVANLFSNIASKVSTEDQIEKLISFVIKHEEKVNTIRSSLQESIDNAKNNLEWTKNHYEKILYWLIKNKKILIESLSSKNGSFSNLGTANTIKPLSFIIILISSITIINTYY